MPLAEEEIRSLIRQAEEDLENLSKASARTRRQLKLLRDMLTDEVLTEPAKTVNTSGNTMEDSLRLSISRGKRKKGDKLAAMVNRAGMSQSMLAELIDVTPAALSRYISGDRKIPKGTAEAIEKATKGVLPVTAWRHIASDD